MCYTRDMMADTTLSLLSGNMVQDERRVKASTVQCAKEQYRLLWEQTGGVPNLPRFGNMVRKDIVEEVACELGRTRDE